jgi:flagellin-like hook-associated protein FlgL
MSVVINTNSAATIAANNLATSNARLQNSLNRLSSGSKIVNPSDDAGGLAVAMKLTATANREGELQNDIGDATSYAQTQDGALQVAGSILDRVSELATLYRDPTKNTSDRANYNDEFTQLQSELTALGSETFNGISLFGTGSLTVATTDDLGAAGDVAVAQQNLAGTPAFATFTDNFADLSDWSTEVVGGIGGSVTASSNTLDLNSGTGAIISATSTPSFSGAFNLTLNFQRSATGGLFSVAVGNASLFTFNPSDNSAHTLRISSDGSGTAKAYLDGSSTAYSTSSGLSDTPGAITFSNTGGIGSTQVQDLSIASTAVTGGVGAITNAAGLGSLSLSTITGAIQDVATMRAENGAEQSRLNFASTLLTTNQTNLASAISRISDVDVAQETTSLAKWNVLVQAGTSMLTQANQSAQVALKLITG